MSTVRLLANIVWPLVIAGLALVGLFSFGILALTSSLWTAVAIGLLVVGSARLFQPGKPTSALTIIGLGLALFLLRDAFPTFTIADGLTIIPGVGL